MMVKLNNKAVAAIEEILKNGDKAVVQRKGNGFIILEEKRKTKYSTIPSRE